MNNTLRIEKIFVFLIFSLGIAISLAQFLYNRSLWLDEAKLALNIINKNNIQLLFPLDYNQVAPILFLQVEKFFSLLLPNSEYGLRLFPLIAFWVSSYLFYKILNLIFKSSNIRIVGLSLFFFNATLVYYSSEVKQYMGDILVLLGLYYVVLKSYKNDKSKLYLLGILGVVSVFLSNVAPIILACIGLYLLISEIKIPKEKLKSIFLLFFVWGISYVIYYAIFIYNHPSKDFMIRFWTEENAFMPINPLGRDFYLFINNTVLNGFYYFFSFGTLLSIFFIFIYCVGIYFLFNSKERRLIILTSLPAILHLTLSSFKLYPYHSRLILYNIPLIIIVFLFGLEFIKNTLIIKLTTVHVNNFFFLIPLFLICNILFFSNGLNDGFPIQRDQIKPCLKFIDENIKATDHIYVYYFSKNPFRYYVDINYFKAKNPRTIASWSNRGHIDKAFDDLKQLKGKNWLLFSHWFDNEETKMIHYLDSLGYPKLNSFKTYGSSAYYYDFGGKE